MLTDNCERHGKILVSQEPGKTYYARRSVMKKSLKKIAAVLISASIMSSLLAGCSIKELILKDGAVEVTPTPSVTPTPTATPTPTPTPTPTAEPTPGVYNFGNSSAYVSTMGYQITIPESWNGRYTVENTENGDVFRCKL